MVKAPKSLDAEDLSRLKVLLNKHSTPSEHESTECWQCLATTVVFGLVSLALCAMCEGWLGAVGFILLTAASVRTFIVFHDCCHLSFFQSKKLNMQVGHLLAPFAGRSVGNWQWNHNDHHHNLGDATHFDGSQTVHHDKAFFAALPFPLRMAYRLLRDPFVFFPIATTWVFFGSALTRDLRNSWPRVLLYLAFYHVASPACFWRVFFAQWAGGLIGILLFHLQHTCNQPYMVTPADRNNVDAGILGSTYVPIAWPLTVMTLGIQYHHIHHASTRVPCYRMRACHEEGAAAGLWRRGGLNVVGPKRAFLSFFHALWEERPSTDGKTGCLQPRFVSFEPYHSLGLHG